MEQVGPVGTTSMVQPIQLLCAYARGNGTDNEMGIGIAITYRADTKSMESLLLSPSCM